MSKSNAPFFKTLFLSSISFCHFSQNIFFIGTNIFLHTFNKMF